MISPCPLAPGEKYLCGRTSRNLPHRFGMYPTASRMFIVCYVGGTLSTTFHMPELDMVLEKCAQCYFNYTKVTEVHIDCDSRGISIITIPFWHIFEHSPSFYVDIKTSMPPGSHAAFVKSFASCNFSSVTTFRFHRLQYLEPTKPALITLLDSVEMLEIGHELILNVLSSVSITGQPQCPVLETLKVECANQNAARNSFATIIFSFIAQRRRD